VGERPADRAEDSIIYGETYIIERGQYNDYDRESDPRTEAEDNIIHGETYN
jgi:hypothetical protein